MNWLEEIKNNVATLNELKQFITINEAEETALSMVIEQHPMSITRYYLSLIDPHNPHDPLRKMIVPSINELQMEGSYDTSGEASNTVMPGLQHKYGSTALLISTNRCAAYCRFCFRKRMVGLPNREVISTFLDAVSYIRQHKEITNVLITGGDSLILPTDTLKVFLEELATIDHLDYIRFGSRIPVVFPQRIIEDRELQDIFSHFTRHHKQIYVVTHFNHPNEFTPASELAVEILKKCGIVINNQTVLFRGVNDKPNILASLMRNLVRNGINPYYVFQCRPVKRVKSHFQVPIAEGYSIVEKAKSQLDGHAKRFKYIMSHKTGKIEIVGIMGDEIILKYHQAKDPSLMGKIFKRKLNPEAGWLDELHDTYRSIIKNNPNRHTSTHWQSSL